MAVKAGYRYPTAPGDLVTFNSKTLGRTTIRVDNIQGPMGREFYTGHITKSERGLLGSRVAVQRRDIVGRPKGRPHGVQTSRGY